MSGHGWLLFGAEVASAPYRGCHCFIDSGSPESVQIGVKIVALLLASQIKDRRLQRVVSGQIVFHICGDRSTELESLAHRNRIGVTLGIAPSSLFIDTAGIA